MISSIDTLIDKVEISIRGCTSRITFEDLVVLAKEGIFYLNLGNELKKIGMNEMEFIKEMERRNIIVGLEKCGNFNPISFEYNRLRIKGSKRSEMGLTINEIFKDCGVNIHQRGASNLKTIEMNKKKKGAEKDSNYDYKISGTLPREESFRLKQNRIDFVASGNNKCQKFIEETNNNCSNKTDSDNLDSAKKQFIHSSPNYTDSERINDMILRCIMNKKMGANILSPKILKEDTTPVVTNFKSPTEPDIRTFASYFSKLQRKNHDTTKKI